MRRALPASWALAAFVALLWLPPLGGFRVGSALEAAFYYGALLLPLAGAALAAVALAAGPPRAGGISALAVHALLFAAYRLLVGAPVS